MDSAIFNRLAEDAANDGIEQVVVGAVIAHDDHVLLLRRPADDFMGGIYELPSGKVEPGETLDTALAREVKEETGLDLARITAYLGAFDYASNSGNPSRQYNFAADITTPEPVRLQEHDAHLWHPMANDAPVTNAVRDVLAEHRRRP